MELTAVITAVPLFALPTTLPFSSTVAMLVSEEYQRSDWFVALEGVMVAFSVSFSPVFRPRDVLFRLTPVTRPVELLRFVYSLMVESQATLSSSLSFVPLTITPLLAVDAVIAISPALLVLLFFW